VLHNFGLKDFEPPVRTHTRMHTRHLRLRMCYVCFFSGPDMVRALTRCSFAARMQGVYTYYTPSVNPWHNLAILAGFFVAFFLLAWAALSFKRMTKR
jgi:hypothetical protein